MSRDPRAPQAGRRDALQWWSTRIVVEVNLCAAQQSSEVVRFACPEKAGRQLRAFQTGLRAWTRSPSRAALRKAEEEFAQRLARDRRAWEQAAVSRGEYVEFDPYARGDRDGRPKRPPKGGRDENEAEKEKRGDVREGDAPRADVTAREMRPAGMSSAHLERVAMREKNKYAQRQRDLAMGMRAEYLVD